jgi:hypothetical protein
MFYQTRQSTEIALAGPKTASCEAELERPSRVASSDLFDRAIPFPSASVVSLL